MTSSEIRQSFLDFFKEKQHTIVPSSSLLPDAPNLLFTNAGMNQFVPIFLGQAPCSYKPARAADTQKCIRAGGKHNDLEDVGFDTYHHTFFEMLGNWSFGDYFKKEAIEWAWELVVNRWGFPPSRVYATIYSPGPGDPAHLDQEAHEHWSEIFIQNKLDPAYHVVHGNKKDNFWMMGDTGPCGPCSELHIDLTPGPRDLDIPRQIAGRNLVNMGDARCIEIWNLVFIQFNANPDGTFTDLPAKHVDTGMGFERVTSMIQGTKGFTDFENAKISNYETDVFRPIFDELEKITGKTYKSTLPASAQNLTEQEKIDVAFRVIADHIRTLSFSIADGIQPSNEGRGYVLRRILRRAVSYGRNLGLPSHFLAQLVPVLAAQFKDIFPNLYHKSPMVSQVIARESNSFGVTLDEGMELFESAAHANESAVPLREKALSLARELERTIEVAGNLSVRDWFEQNRDSISKVRGLTVELSALHMIRFLGNSATRAQGFANQLFYAADSSSEVLGDVIEGGEKHKWDRRTELVRNLCMELSLIPASLDHFPSLAAFKLYDTFGFPVDLTELKARERGLSIDIREVDRLMERQKAMGKAAQKKDVITVEGTNVDLLSPTVFYGYDELQSAALVVANESGALAVSETPFYAEMGGQVGDSGEIEIGGKKVAVTNTIKSPSGKVYFHKLAEPVEAKAGDRVTLHVDEKRRASIEAHHTGTHIMHWALRKVLGTTVGQKGSYVGPDRLRFDFSHGAAATPEEVAEIERLVNEKISADLPVSWEERPYAEVKGDPSILQFFGDKYGESVRVVSIGDFSKELCGGTHVRQSGKIGYFKILHESAIAAGVRRIEAISGDAIPAFVAEHSAKQDEQLAALRLRKADLPAFPVPNGTSPEALWQNYAAREKLLHEAGAAVAQHEKDDAKRKEAEYQKLAANEAAELTTESAKIGAVPFIVHLVDYQPAGYLPVLADAVKKHWQGVVVLLAIDQGKVAMLCSVAPAFTKQVQAGKIIQAMAPLIGGKGGGRPDLAQGGGTNPDGVAAAMEKAEEILQGIK